MPKQLLCSQWGHGVINMTWKKKTIVAISCTFCIGLTACVSKLTFPNYEAHLNKVEAVNCQNTCKYINYNLVVENNSSITYCLPGDQFGQTSAKYIFLRDAHGATIRQSSISDYVNDPFSGNVSADIDSNRTRPVLIIQPHTVRTITQNLIDQFEFARGNYQMNLRLEIYPCDDWAFKTYGYRVVDLKSNIVITN